MILAGRKSRCRGRRAAAHRPRRANRAATLLGCLGVAAPRNARAARLRGRPARRPGVVRAGSRGGCVHVAVPAARPLVGSIGTPGDKSLGHRALLWGALRRGTTVVRGLGGGGGLASTAAAVETLGAGLTRPPDGTLTIEGDGFDGLHAEG